MVFFALGGLIGGGLFVSKRRRPAEQTIGGAKDGPVNRKIF